MKQTLAMICLLSAATGCHTSLAAEATAGKQVFTQRCAICHIAEAADNGGAQGPSLAGVVGRAAGSAPRFSYSAAMRASMLTWDVPTLQRFLAAPTAVVPGSTMVTAVPDETDRDNVIAYLQSLNKASGAAAQAAAIPASTIASANWRLDAPGRPHRISADSLPPPFATESAGNNTLVVPKPAQANLAVPAGFKVEPFATDCPGRERWRSPATAISS